MVKLDDDKSLKPNPFTTYRDPKTGKWVVIHPHTSKATTLGS